MIKCVADNKELFKIIKGLNFIRKSYCFMIYRSMRMLDK